MPIKSKRPRGRPKKPKEEHVHVLDLCLPPDQVEYYKALGGSKWVQSQINEARRIKERTC